MVELMGLSKQCLMRKSSNHFLFLKCATIAPSRLVFRFARSEQHSRHPKVLCWSTKIIASDAATAFRHALTAAGLLIRKKELLKNAPYAFTASKKGKTRPVSKCA